MKYYRVSEDKLKGLLRDSIELNYLDGYGVDNWIGYDEALSDMCDVDDIINDELDEFKGL